MTSKAYTAIAKKSLGDLEKELQESKLALVKLNAELSTGAAAKEAGKMRVLKKKIARIKTFQRSQEQKTALKAPAKKAEQKEKVKEKVEVSQA